MVQIALRIGKAFKNTNRTCEGKKNGSNFKRLISGIEQLVNDLICGEIMTDIARERVSTKILLILAQSVTNIFEYSNILVKNIYLHNVPGASVEGHSDFKVIW